MTLIDLRDKINTVIQKNPSWANVERIGIVTDTEEDTGWKDMKWLVDFRTICCDSQGMVAFELVMEE